MEGARRDSDDQDVGGSWRGDGLADSFARSDGYSLGASWITAKGYIGAAYTRQDNKYGLPGHSHASNFTQDRVAALETVTSGYNMLNATLAYRFDVAAGRWAEFYVSGTNLTNKLAYAHASFVKAQSPLRGRNIVFGLRNQF